MPDVVNNRYKQYILADAGYHSNYNIKLARRKGYIPIILQNKRNIKNKKLIRKLTTKHKIIYKKKNKN